jgi:large subunit ribosomal protein L3
MSIGIIGKKVGMTRIFNEEGVAVAVTVIDISDNVFLQKKTSEKDGYTAVQVGFGDQKESRLNRAEARTPEGQRIEAEAQDSRIPLGE